MNIVGIKSVKSAVALALVVAVIGSPAGAVPPIPLYKSGVLKINRIGDGSVVIKTTDSVDTVCAWYRKNIRDGNGETEPARGGHIFYTHNGATVSVEPGNRFDAGTSIGIIWDAKKYGTIARGN